MYKLNLAEIKRKYKEGKSQDEIAKELDVSQWVISSRLRKSGILIRDKFWKLSRRKYSINETVLNTLTPLVGWVLGWFMSDGFVQKKDNSFGIRLSKKDTGVLNLLRQFFEYTGPLLESKTYLKKTKKWYEGIILKMTSRHLKEKLITFGIVSGKSTKERFPAVIWEANDEIKKQFIKGIFEGDGSIIIASQTAFQIVGTKELLHSIQQHMMKTLQLRKTKIAVNGGSKKNHFCLRYSGKLQCMRIFDWLYADSQWHLERKYQKYLAFKSTDID